MEICAGELAAFQSLEAILEAAPDRTPGTRITIAARKLTAGLSSRWERGDGQDDPNDQEAGNRGSTGRRTALSPGDTDQDSSARPDGQDQGPSTRTEGPPSSENGSSEAFSARNRRGDLNDLEEACRDLSRTYSGRHGARSDFWGNTRPDGEARDGEGPGSRE